MMRQTKKKRKETEKEKRIDCRTGKDTNNAKRALPVSLPLPVCLLLTACTDHEPLPLRGRTLTHKDGNIEIKIP